MNSDHQLGNGEIVQSTSSKKKGWEDAAAQALDGNPHKNAHKKVVDFSNSGPILGAFDMTNPCAITRIKEAPQLRIKKSTSARQTDIILADFSDFDSEDELSVPVSNLSTWAFSRGSQISAQVLKDLNSIIFPPKGKSTFGEEWLGKGFVFRDEEELKYGLIQLKGGPCGLLAAVQAFVIKNLLYEENMPEIS
jgi:hypothetical protein